MPIKRGLPSTLKMRHDRHYVEELASQRGAPIGRMIRVERLEPNPQQPRMELGDLTELIDSIRSKGVLEPLLVRPSEVGGRFMIISGERRYRAAIEAGLEELPCIEMDVDDRAVAEIALIENLQRKDLTPFEEADGLFLLVDRFGYTHEDISQKIGRARSSVTEALSIAALDAEVRELCREAGISSKSMLLQVARLPNIEQMKAFIARIARQGMTRDEARKARNNKQSRPQPFVYRFSAPNREFSLQLKFRKSQISDDELIDVLEGILEELRLSKK
ncbi:MAG: ParB/RepB/Spo0J family partition protein [Acidobacteriota bacterium]|nr:MAG: ParB/RepB/Spo0J family partition protein [Acidobacteriota bacterium]